MVFEQTSADLFATLELSLLMNERLYFDYRLDQGFLGILKFNPGNTKGGSITVMLTSCLTCLD